jgi:two-component system cell cycle response regulator DivK
MHTATARSYVTPDLKGKNILIVEDVSSNYQLLAAYLMPLGVTITHEEYGMSAFETFRKKRNFNLVLMDLRLPDIHGLEITRRIREIDPDVPIIAQTAYAMLADKHMCLEAGCNEYISKPIHKSDFFEILNKFF